jgi:hypothetical protein
MSLKNGCGSLKQRMTIAAFDCRNSQLPQVGDVVDYFRWRSEAATTYLLRVMSGSRRPLTLERQAMFFKAAF